MNRGFQCAIWEVTPDAAHMGISNVMQRTERFEEKRLVFAQGEKVGVTVTNTQELQAVYGCEG